MSSKFSILSKVTIPSDQRDAYLEKVKALVEQSEAEEPKTLGIEWYLNDENEIIVIDSYLDSEAFLEHVANVGELASAMTDIAPSTELLIFGSPSTAVSQMLSSMGARFYGSFAGFTR